MSQEEESDEMMCSGSSSYESEDSSDNEIAEDDEEMTDVDESSDEIDEAMETALSVGQTRQAKTKNAPTALKCSNSNNFLCIGTVEGDLESYNCKDFQVEKIDNFECFASSSCCSLDFSCDGKQAFCLSSTEGFASINFETNDMNFASLKSSTELSCLKTFDENIICVGSFAGHIYLWDIRQFRPAQYFEPVKTLNDETGDYISCIITNSNHLAAGSGSGLVTIFDLRASKLLYQNNDSKADIVSLTQLPNKKIILAASMSSEITIFSWNDNNRNSHRYEILPKGSCNEIMTVNDSTILTAWDDGSLRLNSLFPHEEVGMIGQQNPPAEFADINFDENFAVSIGIDKIIHLWSLDNISDKNSAQDFFVDI
ncbi:hypothetical protein O3M35_003812 [Rhynocoris fuscipes]|uniref:WD repeat-containing protein 55 homolog n=1 Tax=Rhynocoris fuscipes TaxID=488301 RepID=A0AAW1CM60_9HEMI